MAAGIVYHDFTTSAGVTFSLACWVPDTASPNVGCISIARSVDENLAIVDWLTPPSVTLLQERTLPTTRWSYAPTATGIVNTTTAVVIKTAHATLSNYITSIQISSEVLTTATVFAIRNGAAGPVLWQIKIGTTGLTMGRDIVFETPLKGNAATLLEVVALTATGTGAIYFNAQGFVAA